MNKIKFFLCLLVFSYLLALPFTCHAISQNTKNSIVLIKTYVINNDNFITLKKSGSGVILNESGVILTNLHVVNLDNPYYKKNDLLYLVCLNDEKKSEPKCNAYAEFLAKDSQNDIALLKLFPIEKQNSNKFPYLKRITDKNKIQIGKEVFALGYPNIGADTLTVTRGAVSGYIKQNESEWIKTDAITSYGNSGGALINKNEKLLGITSMAYTDKLNAIGYALDITNINKWIDINIKNNPIPPKEKQRFIDFIKKINNAKKTDYFEFEYPKFSFKKPSANWNFEYEQEDSVMLTNTTDPTGGNVIVQLVKLPFFANIQQIESLIKSINNFTFGSIQFVDSSDTTYNNVTGKTINLILTDEEIKGFYTTFREYFISVVYYPGQNNKDIKNINQILKSINLEKSITKDFKEKNLYKHQFSPAFKIGSSPNWVFDIRKDPNTPFSATNKEYIFGELSAQIKDSVKAISQFTPKQFLSYIQDNVLSPINTIYKLLNIEMEIVNKNSNYHIAPNTNGVMVEYKLTKTNSNEILGWTREYFIKHNKKTINLSYQFMHNNENLYNNSIITLNQLLNTWQFLISNKRKNLLEFSGYKDKKMINKVLGKILLQVEDNGEAWYVNPLDEKRYFLGKPKDAYKIMKNAGLGISNSDINKIPIGFLPLTGIDSDNDGLSDNFEKAINSNLNKKDTDNDGINDIEEIKNGYKVWGPGKMEYNKKLTNKLKGRILIQTQNNGEAWYVNPLDEKRYFLGRPKDAFKIMSQLGLGIKNRDLENIPF
jgi:hypothetical protein